MRPLAVLAILASLLAACTSKDNEQSFVANPPNPPLPQTQTAPPASRLQVTPSTGSSSMCPPAYYTGC